MFAILYIYYFFFVRLSLCGYFSFTHHTPNGYNRPNEYGFDMHNILWILSFLSSVCFSSISCLPSSIRKNRFVYVYAQAIHNHHYTNNSNNNNETKQQQNIEIHNPIWLKCMKFIVLAFRCVFFAFVQILSHSILLWILISFIQFVHCVYN